MSLHTAQFISLMKHPVKFRMFLFTKLPSAFFSGLRIQSFDENECTVTVPFKWFTKNPFRSTYFACLAMAAEMSTGALALAHVYKRNPAVSMLVIKMEIKYFKKATNRTSFTCKDGVALKQAIEEAIATGEGKEFTATTQGFNTTGDLIAECVITWSFKRK